MKKRLHLLIAAMFTIMLSLAACSNEAWDELPSPIANFISQYFPGNGVKGFNEYEGTYKVTVNNGVGLTFDSDYQWTEIDGNGSALPEVLIYDQMPPELFTYLQATAQQSEVYGVKRDRKFYKLTMLDTVLTYDIHTGKVTYPGEVSPG